MSKRRSPAKVKPAQMMKLIMQVRGGMLSATDAAAQLGISRKTWYERESRAMTAMMEALEAKPPGRPSSQGDPETQQLRSQISDLQQQVQILEQR
jgi:hypothetical protein